MRSYMEREIGKEAERKERGGKGEKGKRVFVNLATAISYTT